MVQRAAWRLGLFGLQGWHGVFLLGTSHSSSTDEGIKKKTGYEARHLHPSQLVQREKLPLSALQGVCKWPAPSASAHPGVCIGTPPFLTPGTCLPTVNSTSMKEHQAPRVRALLM